MLLHNAIFTVSAAVSKAVDKLYKLGKIHLADKAECVLLADKGTWRLTRIRQYRTVIAEPSSEVLKQNQIIPKADGDRTRRVRNNSRSTASEMLI